MALQLLRYGVPFRIVEKRVDPSSGSKALSMNSLSLQLLDTLELAGPLVAGGHPTRRLTLLYRGKRLTRVDVGRLDLPFPTFLMRPQPETETVMRSAVEARSQAGTDTVETGTELLEVVTGDGLLRVRLGLDGGKSEERPFEYVVACDGAKSTVRTQLSIPFRGYDYGMHFALADVRIEWPGKTDEGYYFVTDETFLILLPLGAGYHRVVAKMDGAPDRGGPRLDDFRRSVAQCGIPSLELKSAIWLSSAPFYNRLAGSFRESNAFLAGDAAHLFSPIGGLGMNTGIGDAFNLGWRLGYVKRGWAPPSLLSTYVAERSKVARQLVAQTDTLTSLIARLDRHERADEERFLPERRNRSFRAELGFRLAGMAQTYGEAPMPAEARTAQESAMLPYAADMYPLIAHQASGRHVLLAAVPSTSKAQRQFASTVAKVRRDFGHCVVVRGLRHRSGRHPAPSRGSAQPGGTTAETFGLSGSEAVLVRPDFYVERRCTLDGVSDSMLDYLEGHYRPRRRRGAVSAPAGRAD